jgi:hypothetical protein
MTEFVLSDSPCFNTCQGIDHTVWDFLPPCVCISLKETPKRYLLACMEFCRVGLCKKVKFFRPTRFDEPTIHRKGTIGCMQSHQAVAQNVGLASASGVTVFEDDVVFTNNVLSELKRVRKSFQYVIQHHPDFFIYFLGHFPCLPSLFVKPHTTRTRGSAGLHAYVLSPRACVHMTNIEVGDSVQWEPIYMFCPKLACKFPLSKDGQAGIDIIISHEKNYATFPMIAFQSAAEATTNYKGNNWMQAFINRPTALFLQVANGSVIYIFLVLVLFVVGFMFLR